MLPLGSRRQPRPIAHVTKKSESEMCREKTTKQQQTTGIESKPEHERSRNSTGSLQTSNQFVDGSNAGCCGRMAASS